MPPNVVEKPSATHLHVDSAQFSPLQSMIYIAKLAHVSLFKEVSAFLHKGDDVQVWYVSGDIPPLPRDVNSVLDLLGARSICAKEYKKFVDDVQITLDPVHVRLGMLETNIRICAKVPTAARTNN